MSIFCRRTAGTLLLHSFLPLGKPPYNIFWCHKKCHIFANRVPRTRTLPHPQVKGGSHGTTTPSPPRYGFDYSRIFFFLAGQTDSQHRYVRAGDTHPLLRQSFTVCQAKHYCVSITSYFGSEGQTFFVFKRATEALIRVAALSLNNCRTPSSVM